MNRRSLTGLATLGLAFAFNIPYAVLATLFDYPGILRMGASTVLDRFTAGGAQLLLAWHGFALTALALIPVGVLLSITRTRLIRWPALTIAAAITVALSGLAQAAGLLRWSLVVPGLARIHADPIAPPDARRAAEIGFDLLNAYGGIAIGETLGQMLLVLFLLQIAWLQAREGSRMIAMAGFVTAMLIAVGSGEGLAIALGYVDNIFGQFTVGGFLALTGWMIATGIGLVRTPRAA
ncbi:DUF4386 family protein [Ralstonia sp.]|uniref:DUF4386 family protein n=1 Tax=Ralstonia sp. TaxID=54061 RepID=UPI002579D0B2|nr:DUF4386 family protein [Ralstonia sp.]